MTGFDVTEDRRAPASRALLLATGTGIGLGALAWMVWRADRRSVAARPRDSAPARARRMDLSQGGSVSAAVTIAAPLLVVLRAVGDFRDGQGLAKDLLGDKDARLRPVEHEGDEVLAWRTEDEAWLVKAILRPVRGGGMTAVTAIVAREHPGSLVGTRAKTTIKEALTRFRMWLETGEQARAR